MKIIIKDIFQKGAATLLLVILWGSATVAQNTVSVSQEGNNNRVSVHHESDQVPSQIGRDLRYSQQQLKRKNLIWVQALTDTSRILLKRSGQKINSYSGPLTTKNSLDANQNGNQNLIIARLVHSRHKLKLSQKGIHNTVKLNPCQGSHSPTKKYSSSHISVKVQGKGNSVQIDN